MKRLLLIAALFLLVGAVVNVAVAWGCAFWMSPSGDPKPESTARVSLESGEVRSITRRDLGGVTYFEATRGRNAYLQETVSKWRLNLQEVDRDALQAPARQGVQPSQLLPDWAAFSVPSPELAAESPEQSFSERKHFVSAGWPRRALWAESLGVITIDGGPRRKLNSQGGYVDAGSFSTRSQPLPRTLPTLGLLISHDRVLPLRPIWSGFLINTLLYAVLLWLLCGGPFALRRFIRLRRGLCPWCAYPMGTAPVCTECGRELPARRSAT